MDIGKRVRAAREAREMTQEELARRAGVPLNRVGRIETGVVTDPHYSTLFRLAGGLGLSMGELLEEESAVPKKALAPLSGRPSKEDLAQLPRETRQTLHRLLASKENPSIYWDTGDILSVREEFERIGISNEAFADWFEKATLADIDRKSVEEPVRDTNLVKAVRKSSKKQI